MEVHTIEMCLHRTRDIVDQQQAELTLLKWVITKIAEDMMRDEYSKDRRNNELLKAIWDDRWDKALAIKAEEESDNEL